MRKSYLILLSVICGAWVISASFPAAAYEYLEHPGVSAVEVDPSVLGDEASQQDQESAPSRPSTPSGGTMAAVPVTPVESAPMQRKLAQPFFTTATLAPEIAPVMQAPPVAIQAPPVAIVQPVPAPVPVKQVLAPVEPPPVPPAPQPVAIAEPPAPKHVQDITDISASLPGETPATEIENKTPAASLTPEETKPLVPDTADTSKDASATPAVPSHSDLTVDFDTTSSTLSPQGQAKLDALASQIKDTDMRLQIRGYAKGDDSDQSSARRMALSRALSVRSYLMDKGIKAVRLDVRALGSETDQTPIDRVDLVFVR